MPTKKPLGVVVPAAHGLTSLEAIQPRLRDAFKALRSAGIVARQKQVAERMAASEACVSAALAGNTRFLTQRFVYRFLHAFPEVSADFVYAGKGEALVGRKRKTTGNKKKTTETTKTTVGAAAADDKTTETTKTTAVAAAAADDKTTGTTKTIKTTETTGTTKTTGTTAPETDLRPYYNVDFLGGFDLTDNCQQTQPDRMVRIEGCARAELWCNILGNSMAPLIQSGDMIGLRPCRLEDIQYGKPYAVVLDDQRTVKFLRRAETDDSLLFVPQNTDEFDPQTFPKSAIRALYEVVGAVHRFA